MPQQKTDVSSVGKGWVQGYGDETPQPMSQNPSNLKAGMGQNPSAGIDASGKVHGMAKGGKVKSKRTYLVGEKGPELFRPKQNGKIIPNTHRLLRVSFMSVPPLPIDCSIFHEMPPSCGF